MFIDMVIPQNNEIELIKIAEKLKIDGLCFLYSCLEKKEFEDISNKIKKINNTNLKLVCGILTDERNILELNNISKINVLKVSIEYRKTIEKFKKLMITGMELIEQKDKLNQRNSGLNHIICKIIKKNEITPIFTLNSILEVESTRRAIVLGRIIQNIKLCRKYKIKTIIASMAKNSYNLRTKHDIKNFFVTLGMHPYEAEESLTLLSKKLIL